MMASIGVRWIQFRPSARLKTTAGRMRSLELGTTQKADAVPTQPAVPEQRTEGPMLEAWNQSRHCPHGEPDVAAAVAAAVAAVVAGEGLQTFGSLGLDQTARC